MPYRIGNISYNMRECFLCRSTLTALQSSEAHKATFFDQTLLKHQADFQFDQNGNQLAKSALDSKYSLRSLKNIRFNSNYAFSFNRYSLVKNRFNDYSVILK